MTGQVQALLQGMRPRQWAKNLLIYLAFFFTLGSHRTDSLSGELSLFGSVTLALLIFSLISGATYLLNDYRDMAQDRLHPTKRLRPFASGRLSPAYGLSAAALIALGGIAGAFAIEWRFGLVTVIYLTVTLAYNLALKEQVLLDIMAVAAGFVLRAAAGAVVIDVPISPWLYVMTSLGALLISLGKRRNELTNLGSEGALHRAALGHYTKELVDQLVAVVAPAMVVSYTLYTFTGENLPADDSMMLTIPFVVYGVFRYLYLVHRQNLGGAPEEILLTDRPLLLGIVLWLGTASAVLLIAR